MNTLCLYQQCPLQDVHLLLQVVDSLNIGRMLFRDFLKFRSGYVVNPVRTRRSVPREFREVYPEPADELQAKKKS